jgi:hypothetical protein
MDKTKVVELFRLMSMGCTNIEVDTFVDIFVSASGITYMPLVQHDQIIEEVLIAENEQTEEDVTLHTKL